MVTQHSSVSDQGYFLRLTEGTRGAHACGGRNDYRGATCPTCRKPLLKFFDFSTADERLELKPSACRRLPTLYCWTCGIAHARFFYQVTADLEVRIVEYGKGEVVDDFPYPGYPVAFPEARVELAALNAEDQEAIRRINSGDLDRLEVREKSPHLCRPQHQYGGTPYLVQGDPMLMNCPECREPMPLLVAVADDAPQGQSFWGNEFAQVLYHLCERCSIVGAYQACD